MKVITEINGIDLKDDFNIVTVSLIDIVTYDIIQFKARIHIEKDLQEFERVQNSIIQVINKNGDEEYDVELVYEVIEETKPLWIINLI